MSPRLLLLALGGIGLALAFGTRALASDGRIEINQAAALAGAVPGDAPGFPVTLGQSGSYVLTSDLDVPVDTLGIDAIAPYVSLDLNGFSVRSTFTCTASACSVGPGTPYGVFGEQEGFSLSNGSVVGFSSECVLVQGASRIENLHVRQCGLNGINVAGGSIVIGNHVDTVGFGGISFLGSGRGLVRGNDVANVAIHVSLGREIDDGGIATGGNRCDRNGCSPRGMRRYYLTPTAVPATSARTACAVGYHMASAFELLEASALEYAADRGATAGDAGSGPPSTFEGRVRTGQPSSSSLNCSTWGSVDPMQNGTQLILVPPASWNAAGTQHAPWRAETARPCNVSARVWCIED